MDQKIYDAHRDYRSGADIQIYIFQDRVEIINPGGLVRGLDYNEPGKSSMPPNPLLFGLLYRMDMVEYVGSGINRIRTTLKTERHPASKIETNANWFSISFQRVRNDSMEKRPVEKTVEETVEKTREKVLALAQANPAITTEEMAERLGLSRRGIEWQIREARKKGLLNRKGPNKGGYWEVVDKHGAL